MLDETPQPKTPKALKCYDDCPCTKCKQLFRCCGCDPHTTCGTPKKPGCGAEMWFVTTPKGKQMPVNSDGTSHFATCPKAANF